MTKTTPPLRGLTLDAGALVALDRNERREWARLDAAVVEGFHPVIPAPVVTQVWRSPRQANLARAIKLCKIESVDLDLARAAGELCAAAGTDDAVDALVVASAARRHDFVVTSDAKDIARLAAHARGVDLLPT